MTSTKTNIRLARIAATLFGLGALLLSTSAYAQSTSTPPERPGMFRGQAGMMPPENRPTTTAEMRAQLEARKEEWKTRLETFRTERAGMIEEKRTEIQARIAEKRAALSGQMQERMKMLSGNVKERITKTISRLQDLADRLDVRMATLEERGVDTTEAEAALEEARAKLEEALAALAGIDTDVEYAATSETPKEDWAGARAQFAAVHTLIKEAHALLRTSVAALKEAVMEAGLERGASAAVSNDASTTTPTN